MIVPLAPFGIVNDNSPAVLLYNQLAKALLLDGAIVMARVAPKAIPFSIDWLPDGAIKPLMYWTPDGSCYQVVHIYEMTPLALLKDSGTGIRFRVRADLTETRHHENPFARHETYLYFVDNLFCARNIVDERYGHAGKEYIPVTLDVFRNGDYELAYFWAQGARYMVEKTLEVGARGSFHAGGAGLWHKVEARLINANDDEDPDPERSVRRLAALYLELNKWFVTVKPHDKPA